MRELPHGEAALCDRGAEALADCLGVLVHHDSDPTRLLSDLTTPMPARAKTPTYVSKNRRRCPATCSGCSGRKCPHVSSVVTTPSARPPQVSHPCSAPEGWN